MPEQPDEYEVVDAGAGLTVYVHKALMPGVGGGAGCRFEFGLFGRCSIVAS